MSSPRQPRSMLNFRCLGALAEQRQREAVEDERRRLRGLVSGKESRLASTEGNDINFPDTCN